MARGGYFARELLRGVHVLVVDSEPSARDALRRILQYCGAFVVGVGSAREGLATMRLIKPAVIIATFARVDDDALWLFGEVRALKPETGGGVPIVAIAGDDSGRERCMAAGIDACFVWPLDPWEFIRAIANVAAG